MKRRANVSLDRGSTNSIRYVLSHGFIVPVLGVYSNENYGFYPLVRPIKKLTPYCYNSNILAVHKSVELKKLHFQSFICSLMEFSGSLNLMFCVALKGLRHEIRVWLKWHYFVGRLKSPADILYFFNNGLTV